MNLLVVEPDEIQAEIHQLSLSDIFTVDTASSFTQAKKMLSQKSYLIVVSEWEIDGDYAASLVPEKSDPDTITTPAVVVVSHIKDEDVMVDAYKQGVAYYFTKPYNVVPLHETLLAIQSQTETVKRLKLNSEQSEQTSRQAVNQAALYSMGMGLLSHLNEAEDVSDIAQITLSALRERGIYACLEFRHQNRPLYFDSRAEGCDETTVKVFTTLRKQGPVFCFGERTMFNAEHVSLLVKQVASAELVSQSLLIDLGTKLLPALNMCFLAWMQEHALKESNHDIVQMKKALHDAFLSAKAGNLSLSEVITGKLEQSGLLDGLNEQSMKDIEDMIIQGLANSKTEESFINLEALAEGIVARMETRLRSFSIHPQDIGLMEIDDELSGLEYF